MSIILNPGSGPVRGETSQSHARANIAVFVADATERLGYPVTLTSPDPVGEDDGRWLFTLASADGTLHEVEMPGLPIEQVRYLRQPGQNIWDYPRLWVDGSSWVWHYALGVVGGRNEA